MVQTIVRHIVEEVPEPYADVVDNPQLIVGGKHHLVYRFVADEHKNNCQRWREDEPVTKLTPMYGSMGSMWWIPCRTKWTYLSALLSNKCFSEWKRNLCSRYSIRENENTPNKNTSTAEITCTLL